jgi:MYM-type Zinc finger with FCS sequence motif
LNFIIRAVVILLAFAFVVYVFKAIARFGARLRGTMKDLRNLREQVNRGPVASAEMTRCVTCGAYISSRDALVITARGHSQAFCSQDCMNVRVAS